MVSQLYGQFECSYTSGVMACYVQTVTNFDLLILWNIALDNVFRNVGFHFPYCKVNTSCFDFFLFVFVHLEKLSIFIFLSNSYN